jgi:dephospho-CoA kinase
MLLVGLTGGIASGKTLVRGYLEELGVKTIDADAVARELVSPETAAWQEIIREFGEDYLRPDGSLDRRSVADLIFSDLEKRKRLEAIIHPLIADEIAARIKRYSLENPNGIIVVDAALMIEVDKHENFDKLIVVYADEETRIRRLMERDQLTRHEAYQRILAQMPLELKLNFADFVIDNNLTPEDTRRETIRVFQSLLQLAEESKLPKDIG